MGGITRRAIMDNIDNFAKNLSNKEISELNAYLLYGFLEVEPNKIQEDFIEEFFGKIEFFEMVKYLKVKDDGKIFFHNTAATQDMLGLVRQMFSHHVQKALEEALKKENQVNILKSKQKVLRASCKIAVKESYIDGIFDKIEGWCNIMDVLIDNKILKESDFKDERI